MTNNFTSIVSQLLKDNPINADEFWTNIETKRNSFYYSLKLFEVLVNPRKRDKYSLHLERMTSMLMIIEYFHNIDKKDPKLVEDYKQLFKKVIPVSTYAARWIFEMFSESSCEEVLVKGFLRVLADLPLPKWRREIEEEQKLKAAREKEKIKPDIVDNKLQEEKELKEYLRVMNLYEQNRQKGSFYHSCIKGIQPSQYKSEVTFSYLCFNDYVFVKDLTVSEQIYVEIVKILYQLLEFSTKTDMTKGISKLLHFLQSMLKFYVMPYREQAKELLIVLRQFRNFEVPVGVLAQELISMLYDEMKGTGCTYRYTLRTTIPALDLLISDHLEYTGYFVSRNQQLIGSSEFCSIDTLRKVVILNILWKVTLPAPQQQQLKDRICRLPIQIAYQYYCKLLKINELCGEATSIEEMVKLEEKYLRLVIREVEKEHLEDLKHVSNQMDELYKNKTHSFFEFPQCEIACISLREFTNRDAKTKSLRVILENQINSYKLHQEKFRVIFRGSDKEFRSIVQAIGEIYEEKTGPLALRNLELYILPEKKQQCLLASYIASQDCWYSNFVYNAFVDEHFYPMYHNMILDLLPGMLLFKTLQSYIKEASRYLSIRIFKCCLEFSGDKKSECVYFCRSLEMGLSALVSRYRYSKEKYEDMDYMQILLEKVKEQDKINEELSVIMDINVCDMFGEVIETVSFEETKIQDFRLCNLPIQYFMGREAQPHTDTLELAILKSQNSKEFDRLLNLKALFKKPREEVLFSFRSIFNCESVKGLFMQSTKGMNVCIDGEMYTGVRTVKIDHQERQLRENRLPVKTFLPFKLN